MGAAPTLPGIAPNFLLSQIITQTPQHKIVPIFSCGDFDPSSALILLDDFYSTGFNSYRKPLKILGQQEVTPSPQYQKLRSLMMFKITFNSSVD